MNWYIEVLKKYAVFEGRASRKEYWYVSLINSLISLVLFIIDALTISLNLNIGIGFLGTVYSLAVFIPALAVTVRRLHDIDHSGWWMLMIMIPFVGVIILLLNLAQESQPGDNKYGNDPFGRPVVVS